MTFFVHQLFARSIFFAKKCEFWIKARCVLCGDSMHCTHSHSATHIAHSKKRPNLISQWSKKRWISEAVSSEISASRNFRLHAMCACKEQFSTYQTRWENWWLGLKVWCLGKCVALGLEKVKSLRSKTKSNIFQWLWLFPYYSLLWISDI